ncbi:monooxygenase [Labrys miyagiensis]|uniref:Monooxygenase n=1 Tax=Labrys miyagiensis TaxID=346912 RepID=A0ABQ6CZP3_9HYPH|nr:FAD-dependent oxidoreductase [Labrys miyagiensis]GLS23721.1 monooxygenase [Labrys miyagiensis]
MTGVAAQCCIVGGGPAGVMAGFLLARAGVEVIVLEKHADFLRDFRGDTIHPSTLELMHELGLIDAFLKLPHDKVEQLAGQVGDQVIPIADFRHLPTRSKFLALMPQWEFLNFLTSQGGRYPGFRLLMQTQATGLIEGKGGIEGVRAYGPQGAFEIRAPLTIAADGRHSILRDQAGLSVQDFGAPMDVLWMRLSRRESDPAQTLGRFDAGAILVMLNRGDYWQCAYVIPKGGYDRVKQAGLAAFRQKLARLSSLEGRPEEIRSWDDVKLLTVSVDRLRQWHRPGLLCIGDAAHTMSPVGGIGINLAIQDAVATANLLHAKLREGAVTDADLAALQRRREWPTRATQWGQVQAQNRIISTVLSSKQALKPPLFLRLLGRFPVLRRIPARLIGMGVRPEHVASPER